MGSVNQTHKSFVIRLTVALALCFGVSSKTIPTNNKINAGQLLVGELGNIELDRISPRTKISYQTFSHTDDNNLSSLHSKRRVTRDTLLNLYRQKQLYQNLNRNLYQSYFQTPISENSYNSGVNTKINADSATKSSNDNNNTKQIRSINNSHSNDIKQSVEPTNGFQKLVTNPYKTNTNPSINSRQIYKLHPGFRVTDSVNHLKYLVDTKKKSNTNNASSNNVKSRSLDFDQDSNRQRRGEFYHNRGNSVRSQTLSSAGWAALKELQADTLNLRSKRPQTVRCASNNSRCLSYMRRIRNRNRIRRRSFS